MLTLSLASLPRSKRHIGQVNTRALNDRFKQTYRWRKISLLIIWTCRSVLITTKTHLQLTRHYIRDRVRTFFEWHPLRESHNEKWWFFITNRNYDKWEFLRQSLDHISNFFGKKQSKTTTRISFTTQQMIAWECWGNNFVNLELPVHSNYRY